MPKVKGTGTPYIKVAFYYFNDIFIQISYKAG